MRTIVKEIVALAFAPANAIRGIYEEIKTAYAGTIAENERLQQYLDDYFEHTWMNSDEKIASWSVYQQDQRPNNSCEGWHHRFKELLAKKRKIWAYITTLQNEQQATDLVLNQLSHGVQVVPQQRKNLKDGNTQVARIQGLYDNGNLPPADGMSSGYRLVKALATHVPN